MLEKSIYELDEAQGLEQLIQKSKEPTVVLDCKTTGRVFFIRRLATNLFFGLCVENNEQTKKKAAGIMSSLFSLENPSN
ncbi:MAG: hypothetical protein GY816_23600 [Cytophagales bacterium]|nr:hypothetical protein [Cytophagales bacterium]